MMEVTRAELVKLFKEMPEPNQEEVFRNAADLGADITVTTAGATAVVPLESIARKMKLTIKDN